MTEHPVISLKGVRKVYKNFEFERLREQAEERGAGLWGACPEATQIIH